MIVLVALFPYFRPLNKYLRLASLHMVCINKRLTSENQIFKGKKKTLVTDNNRQQPNFN